MQVHERLAIALCSVEQAPVLLPVKTAHFISGVVNHGERKASLSQQQQESEDFEPFGLKILYGFCEDLLHSRAYKHGKAMVICCGKHPRDITSTALVVGGFMILNFESDLNDLIEVFDPIAHHFQEFNDQLDVWDCWSALYHVHSTCCWLKLNPILELSLQRNIHREIEKDSIDMEEYVHYDSPLNGNMHVLVPEKLLVFNCPSDLQEGALWADFDGVRYFSAAYYADIFGDFGVSVVVRACEESAASAHYDVTPFIEKGIEVEDLPLDADCGVPTLSEIDRFLSLARHSPGAIAVHGDADGLGAAGTLIAAHLISAHRFRAKDAIAWVRMIHPAALPPAHQRFLRDNEARVASQHHSMPCLSDAALARGAAAAGGRFGGGGALEAMAAALPRSVSTPRVLNCLGIDEPSLAAGTAADWVAYGPAAEYGD